MRIGICASFADGPLCIQDGESSRTSLFWKGPQMLSNPAGSIDSFLRDLSIQVMKIHQDGNCLVKLLK